MGKVPVAIQLINPMDQAMVREGFKTWKFWGERSMKNV